MHSSIQISNDSSKISDKKTGLKHDKMTKEANKVVGAAAARLGRAEGMEAHARTGDIRLKKYGHSS